MQTRITPPGKVRTLTTEVSPCLIILLDIMNRGNKPTFFTSNRQEVIDITIATVYVGNCIKDWHVTEEVSCSDHRYIRFTVTGID